MEKRDNILNELREISPLIAELKKENLYSVPNSYFDNLASQINQKITEGTEQSSVFSTNTAVPYRVHEGYFNDLPNKILEKIRTSQTSRSEVTTELEEIAPLLNTINKAPIYTVPTGFFENFNISNIRSLQPKAKVITLGQRMVRYAVAAVITVLMAVGAYLILGKDQRSDETANVKSAVKNLSEDEIVNFLKAHSTASDITTASYAIPREKEISKSLKEMTNEEIQQYLKENAEPDEAEVDI